jgi:hypothetical protein
MDLVRWLAEYPALKAIHIWMMEIMLANPHALLLTEPIEVQRICSHMPG